MYSRARWHQWDKDCGPDASSLPEERGQDLGEIPAWRFSVSLYHHLCKSKINCRYYWQMPQPWGGRGETSITAASVTEGIITKAPSHWRPPGWSIEWRWGRFWVSLVPGKHVMKVCGRKEWMLMRIALCLWLVVSSSRPTSSTQSSLSSSLSSFLSLLFLSPFFPLLSLPLFWYPTTWEVSKYFLYFVNVMIPLLDSNFNYWAGGRPGKECVCVWHTHVCLRTEKGLALALLPEEWDLEGRMLSSSGAKQLRARAWSQVASQEQPNSCFPVMEFGNQRIVKIEMQCLTWSLG